MTGEIRFLKAFAHFVQTLWRVKKKRGREAGLNRKKIIGCETVAQVDSYIT